MLPHTLAFHIEHPAAFTCEGSHNATDCWDDGDGGVAYLRLEDPPGLSPITTVGRFPTVEAAQLATDEAWAGLSDPVCKRA